MKTSTFTLLILIALFAIKNPAEAQIQRGNAIIGGSIANLNLQLDDPNFFSVTLTPKAGWFVRDNTALGAYVNFGLTTATDNPTTINWGLGALGRMYAGSDIEVLRHGRFFGEATVGVGGQNVSDGGGSTNGLEFGFGPGFAYFITRNLALETLVKYNGVAGFGDEAYRSNLNLAFGFQIHLVGKDAAERIKRDTR